MRNKSSAQNFRLNSALHQRYCMTCCDLLGRVGFGLGRRLRPGQDRNLRHFAENKSSVPNLRASSVPHQTKCVCGELWVGRRLRPGITHMAGYSARCGTQVFRPKVPDKIRSTSVSTLVRWTLVGPETPAWNHPMAGYSGPPGTNLFLPKVPGNIRPIPERNPCGTLKR